MSRLETRLRHGITAAAHARERAERTAELAAYVARAGRWGEAEQLIAQARLAFAPGAVPRLTVWVMIAEGLLTYFRAIDPAASDRLQRARGLARALPDATLGSLASAWLAHIEFDNSDFERTCELLRESLADVPADAHGVLARVALVLANAHLYAGLADEARTWYARAHHAAVQEGDDATLGALVHDRAALRLSILRLEHALGRARAQEADGAALELDAAAGFERLAGTEGLPALTPLWEARLRLMLDERDEACRLFELHRDVTDVAGLRRMRSSLGADHLLARWPALSPEDRAGLATDEAREDATRCDDADPDDRAIYFLAMSQLMAAVGQPATAEALRAQADDELRHHELRLQSLRGLLAEMRDWIAEQGKASLWSL
jgi:hypothetical protein